MHTLYRRQNYRNIRLDDSSVDKETVGVLSKSGALKYVKRKGFILRDRARSLHGARPVLLAISRVDGYDIEPGSYVKGCYFGGGVYAVIDSKLSIVRREK